MGAGRPQGSARPPRTTNVFVEDLVGGYDVSWGPTGCATCGRSASYAELLVFRLWSVKHGKWAGYYQLCGKCWERSNERPDPDPRYVPEESG